MRPTYRHGFGHTYISHHKASIWWLPAQPGLYIHNGSVARLTDLPSLGVELPMYRALSVGYGVG